MLNKILRIRKNTDINIYAYVEGKVVKLENVPDPVFSEKMMGDGIAIIPNKGVVVSPCNGEIMLIAETKHAIGIKMDNGIEILLHLGLDTLKLDGQGINTLCKVGDLIKVNEKIAVISEKLLERKDVNMICMLIFTNLIDYSICIERKNDIKYQEIILKLENRRIN